MLEGEDEQSIGKQMALFQERVLPDLANNIKCGNSLIGPDFHENQQMSLLDEEEMYRVNAFDWEAEFPEVFKSHLNSSVRKGNNSHHPPLVKGGKWGFDAVIGNPPYIQSRSGLIEEIDKKYYSQHFETVQYQINTYGLFTEKGINLLKTNGFFGMIIPNYWLSTDFDNKLRHFIFTDNSVIEIINVYRVFTNATVDTLLLIVQKSTSRHFPKQCKILGVNRSLRTISERLSALKNSQWSFSRTYTIESDKQDISISFSNDLQLKKGIPLADFFTFKFGMKPYEEGKGFPLQTRNMMQKRVYDSKAKIDTSYRPLLRAKNVKRYNLMWDNNWIKYGNNLAAPRDPNIFTGPRLLVRRIVSKNYIEGTYTKEPYICNTDVITLKPLTNTNEEMNILYFLGLILSRICYSNLKSQNVNLDRAIFPKINANTLEKFPVRIINFSDHTDKADHDQMVALVERMLNLHKKLAGSNIPQAKDVLQRQIEATDKQIEQLVYKLYDLTDEEIKIVESET